MPKIKIEALPHQLEAIKAFEKYKNVLLLGGVGSGKSFAMNLFILQEVQRAFQGDDSYGIISANSYSQLRRSVMTELFKNLNAWGLDFNYNQQQSLLTIQGKKKFFCVSSEKNSVEKVRGINAGSLAIDEGCFMDSIDSYTTLLGRVRDPQGSQNVMVCSSPNGYNFMHDLYAGDLKTDDRVVIKAKTKDNIHIDKSFYENMLANLDERTAKQELEGEWVNRGGHRAFYNFDRNKHVEDLTQFKQALKKDNVKGFIGVDINITPYSTVQGYFINGMFYITDETILENADTYMMSDALIQKGYRGWYMVADSTYSKRQTTGKSDKRIFEQNFQTLPSRNPFVIDKIANTCRIIGQGRLKVHKECKTLIKNLEQVVQKADGHIDTTDKSLGHVTDALSYFLWYCDPIKGSIKGRSYSIKR
jgi:hypothetical protein